MTRKRVDETAGCLGCLIVGLLCAMFLYGAIVLIRLALVVL